MDRLSAVVGGLVALAACESRPSEPPAGRTNAAKVATSQVTVEELCDRHYAGDSGPLLQLPAVADGALPASGGGWRWINVWATWCKPCIEELPRLAKWRDGAVARGTKLDLAFVSVDEDPAEVTAFRAAHPGAPPSVRLAEPAKQADWFAALGLDAGAPIPVHVFVRPSGHVACVRAGGIRDRDLAAVATLLGE